MIIFYAPDILETLCLPESDSQHCIKVLRKTSGDIIETVDGKGHFIECRIVDPHPKHTLVEIINISDVEKTWRGTLTVAVAPTKNLDRMEWAIEKMTELGIDRIVPLLCHHSERKELKTERLKKIAVSAMKQSLKARLPEICEMTPMIKFIKETGPEHKFIAYCDKNIERRLLAATMIPGTDATILIGPEGDFSPEEVEAALREGFVPVSLGESRLRTETAAVTACDTFHILQQL